ncbi:hypothetical protein GNI_018430 [Gregarina niphandrodes]|uniref:Uncharacterized protein n=1 Tax=Gregarina niphandrodes TaxID=110365 RepID=A0A023BC09_GRENI|nr:hypothetical protein GNI_018430 [Gregarina niphandrodes]EZG81701.1 hypothetical protein GNI_018430 [Gregarina niphandrodes]|eukprot:XP_011134207.1 hypothetical protein GNI_018430 [Gregarina niphandrodes]
MDVLPPAVLNLRRQSSEALGLLKNSFKYDPNPKVALAQIGDWFASSTFDGITYGVPRAKVVEAGDKEKVVMGRTAANGGVLVISPGREVVASETKKPVREARREEVRRQSLGGEPSLQGSLPYESPRSPVQDFGPGPGRRSIVQDEHVVKRKSFTVNVDRSRRCSAQQRAPEGTTGCLLQLVSRRLQNLQPSEVLDVDVSAEMLVIRNKRQSSSRSIPLLKNEPGAKLTAVSSIWTDELQRYCIAIVTTSSADGACADRDCGGDRRGEEQTLWVIDVARALLLGRWVRPMFRHYCTRVSYASEGAVALLAADHSSLEIVLLPETETTTRMRLLALAKLTLPISSLDTFTVSYRAPAALAVCVINEGSAATMVGEIQANPEITGTLESARVSWYSGPLPYLDVRDAGGLNTEQLRAILTVAIGFDDQNMYCHVLTSWFQQSTPTEKLDLLQNDLLESLKAQQQQGNMADAPAIHRHIPGRWRVDLIGMTWPSVLFDVVYDDRHAAQPLVKKIFTLSTRGDADVATERELAEACDAYSAHQAADQLGDAIVMAALELHAHVTKNQ